jgi:hypothetical protein
VLDVGFQIERLSPGHLRFGTFYSDFVLAFFVLALLTIIWCRSEADTRNFSAAASAASELYTPTIHMLVPYAGTEGRGGKRP